MKFSQKILRIGDFEKRPFWIFFQKNAFFCLIPMKISHKLCDNITLYSVFTLMYLGERFYP